MKANNSKFGKVEIKEVKPSFVIIVTEKGERKQLMRSLFSFTDDNGNIIDLDSIVIDNEESNFQMPDANFVSSRPAQPKKMKLADMLASLNDNKQFDLKTKTWK